MLSLKTAQERRDAAADQLERAHRAAIEADDAVDRARRELYEAEDRLHQAKWGSVPCPVCGARRGQNCRLERDAPRKGGTKDPGILHSARVAKAAESAA